MLEGIDSVALFNSTSKLETNDFYIFRVCTISYMYLQSYLGMESQSLPHKTSLPVRRECLTQLMTFSNNLDPDEAQQKCVGSNQI